MSMSAPAPLPVPVVSETVPTVPTVPAWLQGLFTEQMMVFREVEKKLGGKIVTKRVLGEVLGGYFSELKTAIDELPHRMKTELLADAQRQSDLLDAHASRLEALMKGIVSAPPAITQPTPLAAAVSLPSPQLPTQVNALLVEHVGRLETLLANKMSLEAKKQSEMLERHANKVESLITMRMGSSQQHSTTMQPSSSHQLLQTASSAAAVPSALEIRQSGLFRNIVSNSSIERNLLEHPEVSQLRLSSSGVLSSITSTSVLPK